MTLAGSTSVPFATEMTGLSAPRDPYRTGNLPVTDGHVLYWEESGNPEGVPLLFLHGGPGGGASPFFRRLFDPDIFRLVMFDQRGAGRSTPAGSLEANTTSHLVDDVERLRSHLGIGRWALCGSSWGAVPAIEYAKRHPEQVAWIALYSSFLARRADIDWFMTGAKALVPGPWNAFAAHVLPEERGELLQAYRRRLGSDRPGIVTAAALSWARYEALLSQYPRVTDGVVRINPAEARNVARISAHYFANDCFLGSDGILAAIERIAAIPGAIVHGAQDAVCPAAGAEALARSWPAAELEIVPDEGHAPQVALWSVLTSALLRLASGVQPGSRP